MKSSVFYWAWDNGKVQIDPDSTRQSTADRLRTYRNSPDYTIRRIGNHEVFVRHNRLGISAMIAWK